jgi:ABC-type glycerol-3-phosphate transport system substrate-binding protein
LSKRLIALLAGVMALAIVAAGCGSSSDSTTDTTVVVLTKTEFIKQGDAICKKGSESLSQEAEDFADENDIDTEKPTKKQQEEVIETVVGPALQTQADELRELGDPDGEEDKMTAIVDALEAGAKELEDDPGALLESGGKSPLDEANELANEFGFKQCGQE